MTKSQTLNGWIDRLDHYSSRPAVIEFEKNDVQQFSFEQLHRLSGRFAHNFKEAGLGQHDRVAFLAPNSFAWIAACLGGIRAGAVPVPLDVQFDDDALVHAFNDSEPRLLVTDEKQSNRLVKLDLDSSPEVTLLPQGERSWHRLPAGAATDLPRAKPDDDAVLFYTSGTTGPPKGVPLLHKNIAAQIDVLIDANLVDDDDRILLPLPLHHVYPFVVGMLTPLARGLPIVLPSSITGPQIVRALNEAEVTIVIGVPRLYRALYDGITAKAASSGRLAKLAFHSAFGVSRALRRRLGVRAGKWLLRPLHRQFGPNLRVLACGGSPLDDELAWKLESLGWRIAIGYGLTETSPLLTLNPPGRAKIGTVGKTVGDVELRIDDDAAADETDDGKSAGEILARGTSVFRGYRNLPEKTNDALTDDGWFRTGDLGFLDDGGYLHVTGRKGTMIVTEGGENVQPNNVESAYAEHSAIREIGVLQDGGKLVALIVPETSEVETSDDRLEEKIQSALETQAAKLPSYQRLGDFRITRQSLPRTRLGKIQRHKLRQRFEQSDKVSDETTAKPISIEDMNSGDRALLDDPAATQTWEVLAEKYADRHLTPDTNMRLDLGVDSLEWLNLSLEIRRRAGAELDEEAIGRIETVRELLEEATDASTHGVKLDDAAPLTDPESVLTDRQLRHLQPHGWLNSVIARGMFATNRLLMRLMFRLEVHGVENLPETPVVITPNHASHLDPLAIAAALPAKRLSTTFWAGWTGHLFTNPITRWFSRLAHVLPIDPQRGVVSSLAFGAAAMDRDRNLVWFPEGERSRDGRLKPFRAGIGLLLEHHETTVIPTVIAGAYEAFPPHKRLPRPRKIRVTFGKPLDSNELKRDRDKQETHEQISRALHEAVESLDSRKLEQKAKNTANSY